MLFNDPIMCYHVWILLYCFHRYMIAEKTLLDYSNSFPLNGYQKNYKIYKELHRISTLKTNIAKRKRNPCL